MDGQDFFKLLSKGAKFDFKRFANDAAKFKLVKTPANEPRDKPKPRGEVKPRDEPKPNLKRGPIEPASDDDSDSDSEDELQILGNLKSSGVSNGKAAKKKKRRATADDLHQEHVNRLRNENRIHVYGTDIPEPLENFSDLSVKFGVSDKLARNIESMGYESPTPVQKQAVTVMLSGREILASAPTGSGKTLAFLIPVVHHLVEPRNQGARAVILAPSRELALQIHRECCRLTEGLGFRVEYINKTSGSGKKAKSKKVDILVTTPNRLIYLLDEGEMKLSSVEWLIVDESDKLFEEGTRGFRDQLGRIYQACDNRKIRRGLFSATYAYDVEEWCRLNLDNLVSMYIGARNAATDSIQQELLFVGSESGKLIAMRDLIKKGFQPPVLIFVQSKDRAKELFHELIYDGMNVDVIHADRTQVERDNVIRCFRAGKIWILICTELMGRGIDFKGVNLVVNYDFPASAVSYIHRIGRTGRAGRSGRAVTFFTEDDSARLRSIANVMKQAGCPVPEYMLSLKAPSRKEKKKLAKSVTERDAISTVSDYDKKKIEKRKKIREKIDAKKKKKAVARKLGKEKKKMRPEI